ncbi:MAG TPA: hypothetical protein VII11_00620 [Bacteroidota bacterium]
MQRFKLTTEDKKQKGYRFSRLAFWACSIAFALVLREIHDVHDAQTLKEITFLFLVYCVAVCVSLGIFAVKDVANLYTAKRWGNGSNPPDDEQPQQQPPPSGDPAAYLKGTK